MIPKKTFIGKIIEYDSSDFSWQVDYDEEEGDRDCFWIYKEDIVKKYRQLYDKLSAGMYLKLKMNTNKDPWIRELTIVRKKIHRPFQKLEITSFLK